MKNWKAISAFMLGIAGAAGTYVFNLAASKWREHTIAIVRQDSTQKAQHASFKLWRDSVRSALRTHDSLFKAEE